MYRKTENLDGREKKGETIIMDYFSKKLYLNLIYVDNVSIFLYYCCPLTLLLLRYYPALF